MSARYTDLAETVVEWTDPQTGRVWSILLSSDGEVRRKLQEWLDAGNTVDPYVAPEVQAVTRLQFYKQLKASSRLAQIRTLASGWASDSDARIEWEAGDLILKDGPLVTAVKTELGLTDQQVTNFFNGAALL